MFDQKVIVITGASGGLGHAVATYMSQFHCDLILVDIKDSELSTQKNTSATIHTYHVNLISEDEIMNFAEEIKGKFNSVDILINNAGYLHYNPVTELQLDEWDKVLNVNLRGNFLVTKYISPLMIAQNKGKILNISSVAAISGVSGGAAYSSSKAGILGLTSVLAKELAPYNINVNAVSPGPLDGEFLNNNSTDHGKKQRIERTLLKRIGYYEDIVAPICFMVSDGADWITGQNLYVDGGYTSS